MKNKDEHKYVLIMAGGSGTRLYPRSTDKLPKQFQQIIGDNSLIQQAYYRARKIVADQYIYVSSNHKYIDLIKKHLPNIPTENYITEPVKRNTGPAISLATAYIYKKDKNAIIVAVHSDHLVLKIDEYVKMINIGIEAVKKNSDYILCIGITPTSPHTGLGYIEKDKKFKKFGNSIVFSTKKFVEKPNLEKAKEYVSSGNFFWNAGYFIWQANHYLEELKKFNPKLYKGVTKIANAQDQENFLEILDSEFIKFDDIAVDNLIMEKTDNLLVLPVDIGWSDIGSWDVVADMVSNTDKDLNGNYSKGTVINIDTHNTVVYSHDSSKVIATIGLDNFIIVTTEEAIVIVPRGRSEDVKKIVLELMEKNKGNI